MSRRAPPARPRRLWRTLARLVLLCLVWLAGVAAWIHWVGERDDARPADAIVVLGAAAYDAVPSPVFKARIEHGGRNDNELPRDPDHEQHSEKAVP